MTIEIDIAIREKIHDAHIHFQEGRLEEARQLYAEICELTPADATAQFNLGTVLDKLGHYEQAEVAYRHAIRTKPDFMEAHLNLGNCLMILGRLDEAVESFTSALKIRPNIPSYYNLGNVCMRQQSFTAAVDNYRQALALAPESPDIHNMLGAALFSAGCEAEAEAAYRKALTLKPDFATTHNQLGALLASQNRFEEAERHYREVLRLTPKAHVHYALGTVLAHQHRNDEAITHYREALRYEPNYAEAFNNMGNVLHQQNRFNEAEAAYREALRQKPDYVEAHLNLGSTLETLGKLHEARAIYHRTVSLDPSQRKTVDVGLANTYSKQGDYQRALALLQPFLDVNKIEANVALAFSRLCRPLGRCDEAIEMLEQLLRHSGPIMDVNDRLLVHFSLGRLLDAAGEYNKAFEHFRIGNSLVDGSFDPELNDQNIQNMMRAYNASFIPRMPRATVETQRPVFIVGMLRSGTSLVEQILCSHPAVYGAGELEEIDEITTTLPTLIGTDLAYPHCIAALTSVYCNQSARRYLEHFAQFVPTSAMRVTDKMPGNFYHLGLISQLFPKAKIIHCIRDPIDTCLSCYFQHFGWRLSYTKDLSHLGLYYRQYRRLMDHWATVLDMPMLHVRYEDLVSNQEAISRTIVEFCGLEWDDHCLSFYENRRVVTTASNDQVRQPMYDRSVGRWRHYAAHLQPLKKALEFN